MTNTGMRPEQGDIVLIPVPFSDLSSRKRRPVVVISNDAYNRQSPDIVVVAMTSDLRAVDHSFTITTSDLSRGALNHPGKVRVDKLYSLSQSIVIRIFGRVRPDVLDQIRTMLQHLTAEAYLGVN